MYRKEKETGGGKDKKEQGCAISEPAKFIPLVSFSNRLVSNRQSTN
jgi:hypothetical protein